MQKINFISCVKTFDFSWLSCPEWASILLVHATLLLDTLPKSMHIKMAHNFVVVVVPSTLLSIFGVFAYELDLSAMFGFSISWLY